VATIDELRYILNAEDGNLQAAFNKVVKEHGKVAKTVEKPLKLGIDQTRLNKTIKSVRDIGLAFAGVAVAVTAAFRSVRALVNFTTETAKLAGQVENLRKSFENLTKREGVDANNLFNELRASTKGAVSNIQLLQNATQAKFLGIDLRNLPTLFEFATIRARETGESVDFLTDSIVKGVGRRSILILDNLGLTIREINAEIESVAREQGIWNGVIDENIRSLVFQEAVVNIANKGIETSAKLSENAATQLEVLNATFQNFLVTLGTVTTGPVSDLIVGLTDVVQFFDDLVVATNKVDESTKDVNESLQVEGTALEGLIRQASLASPVLGELANFIKNFGDEAEKTGKILDSTSNEIDFLAEAAAFGPILLLGAAALVAIGEGGIAAQKGIDAFLESGREAVLPPRQALDELSAALADFDVETQDVAEDLKELGNVLSTAQVAAARKAIDEQQKLEDFLFRSNRISLDDFKDILEQRLAALKANSKSSILEVAKTEVQLQRIRQQRFDANLEEPFEARTRLLINFVKLEERLAEGSARAQERVDARRLQSDNELQASLRQNAIETSAITVDALSSALSQIQNLTRGTINQILALIAAITRAIAAFQRFQAARALGQGSLIPLIGPAIGILGGISTLLGLGNLTAGGSSQPGPIPAGPNIGPTATGLTRGPQGNLISSLAAQPQPGINNAQVEQNNRDLVEAIQGIRIEINSELDAIKFFRKNFPKFQRTQREVSF